MSKHKTLRKIIAYIIISPMVALYVFAGVMFCIDVLPMITLLDVLVGLKKFLIDLWRYVPVFAPILVYGLMFIWALVELDKQKRESKNKK